MLEDDGWFGGLFNDLLSGWVLRLLRATLNQDNCSGLNSGFKKDDEGVVSEGNELGIRVSAVFPGFGWSPSDDNVLCNVQFACMRKIVNSDNGSISRDLREHFLR